MGCDTDRASRRAVRARSGGYNAPQHVSRVPANGFHSHTKSAAINTHIFRNFGLLD